MKVRANTFLYALVLSLWLTAPQAHDSEPGEFIIMKVPYRHLLLSPLPTITDGAMNIEKVILDASVAKKPNLSLEMDEYLSMVIYALQQDDAYYVKQYWLGFLDSVKNNEIHVDVNAVMYWVMREAFIDPNKELSFAASRYKSSRDAMNIISDELNRESTLYESLSCEIDPEFAELCSYMLSPHGNIMEVLFLVFSEAIESTNEDKRYFLEKLGMHNDVGQAIQDYLNQLSENVLSLSERVEKPDNDDD